MIIAGCIVFLTTNNGSPTLCLLCPFRFSGAQRRAGLRRYRAGPPLQPEAEARRDVGNYMAAVESSADILKLDGPGTKVIELAGKRVTPGFSDAHVHFIMADQVLPVLNCGMLRAKQSFSC
jgi:hypothetical protein